MRWMKCQMHAVRWLTVEAVSSSVMNRCSTCAARREARGARLSTRRDRQRELATRIEIAAVPVGHALQLVLGFQTVILSYWYYFTIQTKLYCFLHIQKDDGPETKRVLEYP